MSAKAYDKQALMKRKSFFHIIATTELGAMKGKKTTKCFIDSHYNHRGNFSWFSRNQPNTEACIVVACAFKKGVYLIEAARALPGVEQIGDIVQLGRSLIDHGYTLTLPQIEYLLRQTKSGRNTGMQTNGQENFFFVKTEYEYVPISVCNISGIDFWHADPLSLDDDSYCNADYRLFICNLDVSKL